MSFWRTRHRLPEGQAVRTDRSAFDAYVGRGAIERPARERDRIGGNYSEYLFPNFLTVGSTHIAARTRILERGTFRAMAIGPKSTWSNIMVMPNDIDFPSDGEWRNRAIMVSAHRPWVGEAEGPFTLFPASYRGTSHGGGGVAAGLTLKPFNELQALSNADLHIQLWREPPAVLPEGRQDFQTGGIGSTVSIVSQLIHSPTVDGRRKLHFTIEATAFAGGATTLFTTLIGRNGSVGINPIETVLLQDSEANLNTTMEYDGDCSFDFIDIYVATNAGTASFSYNLIARD